MKYKVDISGTSPISQKEIEKIVNSTLRKLRIYLSGQIIEILFVKPDKIKLLNKKHLHKNEITDVLSFPQKNFKHSQIFGSIVICPLQAKKLGESIKELIIHGLLHLAGYDHKKDNKKWQSALVKINYDQPSKKMKKFSLKKLVLSFHNAFRGVIRLLDQEQNARIHASASILVGILAYVLKVTRTEASILFMAVILVFTMEIMNTAIEKISDLIQPKYDKDVAFIKDGMAGAVLLSSLIAIVVAILIFLPHLKKLIE